MKKSWFCLMIIVFLLLFLISCKPTGKGAEMEANLTLDENVTPCIAGWKCIGKWNKAYLSGDCNWSKEIECILGCIEEKGICRTGETCNSGWECIDGMKLGFKKEDCNYINVKKCEAGCLNAECLPVPEKNETETETKTTTKTVEEVPVKKIFTLYANQVSLVEINKVEYNMSIYNIESGKVKIKLGDTKSDWVLEGGNHSHSSGLIMDIKEILYQPYPGGTQMVIYSVR